MPMSKCSAFRTRHFSLQVVCSVVPLARWGSPSEEAPSPFDYRSLLIRLSRKGFCFNHCLAQVFSSIFAALLSMVTFMAVFALFLVFVGRVIAHLICIVNVSFAALVFCKGYCPVFCLYFASDVHPCCDVGVLGTIIFWIPESIQALQGCLSENFCHVDAKRPREHLGLLDRLQSLPGEDGIPTSLPMAPMPPLIFDILLPTTCCNG